MVSVWLRNLRIALVGIVLAVAPLAAVAQQVIRIGDDYGGLVAERARIVDQIRAAHARVEIRGNICFSACTMYLGAGDVCVLPGTTFGFHGPMRNGQALSPHDLDHWSAVMARYYSEPLRTWYMANARYRTWDAAELTGADLIRLGYPAC